MFLILNCGSQSIKWKVFEEKEKKLEKKAENKLIVSSEGNYRKLLTEEIKNLKKKYPEIRKIGHRVVHGGDKLKDPVKVTPEVLKELEKLNKFAPLHNPFNILGIKIARKIFPKSVNIAVFDTGFFKYLPEKSYTYAIPENIREKYKLRKFGFHGISHEYLAKEASKKLNKPLERLNLITCHLGGGSSITAIKNGYPIDTSMGFTPLEGLVMMTRCGDIDPGIILYLTSLKGVKKVNHILNYQSGIKGICGFSEMTDVLNEIKKGNKKAKLALDIFVYRIQKYICAYFGILKRVDAIVFSGAIGYGSFKIRNMIVKDLTLLKNTKIFAIKTDEELAIAEKLFEL